MSDTKPVLLLIEQYPGLESRLKANHNKDMSNITLEKEDLLAVLNQMKAAK